MENKGTELTDEEIAKMMDNIPSIKFPIEDYPSGELNSKINNVRPPLFADPQEDIIKKIKRNLSSAKPIGAITKKQ